MRHTICALVTGFHTCALPICAIMLLQVLSELRFDLLRAADKVCAHAVECGRVLGRDIYERSATRLGGDTHSHWVRTRRFGGARKARIKEQKTGRESCRERG